MGWINLQRLLGCQEKLSRMERRERLCRHEDSPITKGIPLRGQADGRRCLLFQYAPKISDVSRDMDEDRPEKIVRAETGDQGLPAFLPRSSPNST